MTQLNGKSVILPNFKQFPHKMVYFFWLERLQLLELMSFTPLACEGRPCLKCKRHIINTFNVVGGVFDDGDMNRMDIFHYMLYQLQ